MLVETDTELDYRLSGSAFEYSIILANTNNPRKRISKWKSSGLGGKSTQLAIDDYLSGGELIETAHTTLMNTGIPSNSLVHINELSIIKSNGSKTDILTLDGKIKISVKMEGEIQLTSARTRQIEKKLEWLLVSERLQRNILQKIRTNRTFNQLFRNQNEFGYWAFSLDKIQELVRKNADNPKSGYCSDIEKFKECLVNPDATNEDILFGNVRIKDRFNWDVLHTGLDELTEYVQVVLDNNPEVRDYFLRESLTAEKQFRDTLVLSPNWIMSPRICQRITQSFVRELSEGMEVSFRGKPGSHHDTEISMRVDLREGLEII